MENDYIILNGNKGIFTLDEVIDLCHNIGVKVKIVMSKNGDSYKIHSNDLHSSERKEE